MAFHFTVSTIKDGILAVGAVAGLMTATWSTAIKPTIYENRLKNVEHRVEIIEDKGTTKMQLMEQSVARVEQDIAEIKQTSNRIEDKLDKLKGF